MRRLYRWLFAKKQSDSVHAAYTELQRIDNLKRRAYYNDETKAAFCVMYRLVKAADARDETDRQTQVRAAVVELRKIRR